MYIHWNVTFDARFVYTNLDKSGKVKGKFALLSASRGANLLCTSDWARLLTS